MEEKEASVTTFAVEKSGSRLRHVKAPGHRTEYITGAFAAVISNGPTQVVLYRDVIPDVIEVVDLLNDENGKPVSMRTKQVELPGGPVREDVVTLVLTDEALRAIHSVLTQHLERVVDKKTAHGGVTIPPSVRE